MAELRPLAFVFNPEGDMVCPVPFCYATLEDPTNVDLCKTCRKVVCGDCIMGDACCLCVKLTCPACTVEDHVYNFDDDDALQRCTRCVILHVGDDPATTSGFGNALNDTVNALHDNDFLFNIAPINWEEAPEEAAAGAGAGVEEDEDVVTVYVAEPNWCFKTPPRASQAAA